jgi:hypothetical protein
VPSNANGTISIVATLAILSFTAGYAAEAKELPDRPTQQAAHLERDVRTLSPDALRTDAFPQPGCQAARPIVPATGSTFVSTNQCPWYWPVLRCNYLGQCFCTLF